MPDQLRLFHPSEGLVNCAEAEAREELAHPLARRFFGNLMHNALARTLGKQGKLSLEDVWYEELNKLYTHERVEMARQSHLFQRLQADLGHLMNCQTWKEIFDGARILLPELPLCGLHRTVLTVGTCDVYVETQSGERLLVEWKTRDPGAQVDLHEFSAQQGYSQQVLDYVGMVKRMRTESKVRGFVWFTSFDGPVEIKRERGGGDEGTVAPPKLRASIASELFNGKGGRGRVKN